MTDTAQAPALAADGRRRNDQQDRASFYLTGHRMETRLSNVEGLGLRSAHFAPYRRLAELRYDYPLVLADGPDVHATMWSLSGLVDDLLARVATGEDAARVRHHAFELEREIRLRADAGPTRLSAAWDDAARALLGASTGGAAGEPDAELADSLARLTAARAVDGALVACGRNTPREVVGHLWGLVQRERERHLTARVAHLRDDLRDILDAEQASSPAGLAGDRLAASLGPVVGAELDTDVLSRMLTDNRPRFTLSDSRRARVRRLLDVLTTQRFVPGGEDGADDAPELYDFVYTDVQAALAAHRERFAATTELAKALVMAGMEADGRYREEIHDALFDRWSVADLDTDTLALFPEYLVRVDAEEMTSEDSVALLEALAAGLPIKVLVQVNDLLRGATQQTRPADAGLSARMLASTALASGESFVMQCASSALYHARDTIVAGSSAPGAALFVVYSGEGEWLDDLPHYLAAAAAIESRVFPSYAYDPGAGDTLADRFTLGCNPQPTLDWPVRRIAYQDDAVQRVTLDVPFTAADFWACDARLVPHLALAADDGSDGKVVPFAEHVASNPGAWTGELPYVLMISRDDRLHRVLVDRPLIHLTQRSVEQWHRLQELGGIHNSHVALELARMRAQLAEELAGSGSAVGGQATAGSGSAADAQAAGARAAAGAQATGARAAAGAQATTGGVGPTGAATVGTPGVADNAEDHVDEPQAHDPYLPWIETARCATCNECTAINDRMFRYNEDRQAYIADPDAGTYAELVLAAESCQVAIIHPGRPRNPDEPGLDALVARAEAFT